MQSMVNHGNPDFKLAADIDFVSYLFCRIGTVLPHSTSAWLAPHSIEKYLKAILVKNNEQAWGHGIEKLWKKCTPYLSQDKNFSLFTDMIKKLNSITTNTRYLENGLAINMFDTAEYILFATRLRYILIQDKEKYQELGYGLSIDIITLKHKKKEIIDFLDLHFKEHRTYSPFFGDLKPLDFDNNLSLLYSSYPWLTRGYKRKKFIYNKDEVL